MTALEEVLRADLLFNRGQTYSNLAGHENFKRAIHDFEEATALQADKDSIEKKHKTHFNLGVVYRRVGNTVLSKKNLLLAVTCNIAKAATQNNLGLSYFDAGEFEEARECFEKARIAQEQAVNDGKGSTEDLAFYYNNMGLCHYHLARPMEEDAEIMQLAITNYNLAIENNPHNPVHYFNRGNVYLNMKDFKRAIDDFDIAIDKEPTNPKFYHAKGLTFQTAAD